ncbi:hypothetical protein H010_11146 [Hydrogenophaga taeniospiralis CCUG 15921]|uniref:Uncharacterized protein n=1 Tax=Hydrogenophaga taeniospiralis CCUG 15921 TaxID=1281780 RepID=A0A9X4SBS7_9BURK|nr:hypothetical protein [Hydrogenophaga taeniospiralis]MDG5975813.1 hypothetical protein [Hydrogenophaga taeniospiralis CCUG 15921]
MILEQTTLDFFIKNKDAFLVMAGLGALATTSLTAMFSLLGAIQAKKIDERIKRQEAIRKLLEDGMIGIGENMHEILATADILVKKFQLTAHKNDPSLERSIQQYKDRIDNNKKHLQKAKTVYRYKLYGLDEGLSAIARVADWVKRLRDNIELASAMLKLADEIRKLIDREIIYCYRNGDYPRKITLLIIKFYAWRIRRSWNERA